MRKLNKKLNASRETLESYNMNNLPCGCVCDCGTGHAYITAARTMMIFPEASEQ